MIAAAAGRALLGERLLALRERGDLAFERLEWDGPRLTLHGGGRAASVFVGSAGLCHCDDAAVRDELIRHVRRALAAATPGDGAPPDRPGARP